MARWLAPRLWSGRAASISGRLAAIPARGGYFPALLPAPDHRRVIGMVFDAALSPDDWRALDIYEGREYRRGTAWVSGPGGRRRAFCYRWVSALPPAARSIGGGDFGAWLSRHRLAAFGAVRREI